MRVVLDLLDERTRIFGLFHSWMWQSRYSEVDVNLVERWGQTGWLSNHNGSLRSCSHERNVYRFLSTRTGRVFCHDGSPRSVMIWIWVWLAWLDVFWLSSNFRTHFFHPIMFQGNLWRLSRECMYNFSNTTSPVSIRTTFGMQLAGSVSWRMMAFDRVW